MNKKGDKIISIYWFAILLLVAGGIIAMVNIFYNHPYDVRAMEGTIMNNQISDCISHEGKLDLNIFEKDFQDNFLERCHLNFDTEKEFEWGDTPQYYISIQIYAVNNLVSPIVDFNFGNLNLISSCEIENENYNKLAKCVDSRFYAIGEKDEQYLIKILSIVRKTEKNVK